MDSIGLDWIGLDWIGLDGIGLDGIGLDWIGLDWIGLDWIGLDWTGLDGIGWDWMGLDWTTLHWNGLDGIGLDYIALDCIGLDWTGLDWTGLDWIGLDRWTSRWIRKWRDGRIQRGTVKGSMPTWKVVRSGGMSLKGPYWDQYCGLSSLRSELVGLSAPSESLQMPPGRVLGIWGFFLPVQGPAPAGPGGARFPSLCMLLVLFPSTVCVLPRAMPGQAAL